jgi:hypothetical protein
MKSGLGAKGSLCFLAMVCVSRAATLRTGVAKADITTPRGELMWGLEDRTTPAKSTLDPLYARVLELEALALVTLDPRGGPKVERDRVSAAQRLTHA